MSLSPADGIRGLVMSSGTFYKDHLLFVANWNPGLDPAITGSGLFFYGQTACGCPISRVAARSWWYSNTIGITLPELHEW